MLNIAERLDAQLRAAGVPILGVSLGRRDDRSSWEIQFTPEATKADGLTGQTLLTNFDIAAEEVLEAERGIERQLSQPLVTAMLSAFSPMLGKTVKECEDALRAEMRKG